MKSPGQMLTQLAWFGGTVALTLTTMWLILYPGIYFLVLRKNPFKLYYNIIPAILVALGSSSRYGSIQSLNYASLNLQYYSSAITLPVTMRCMEEKNKLALPVSRFFLPLGMTMHMPGPATYYPMVALFVAQTHGITPTIPMLISLRYDQVNYLKVK